VPPGSYAAASARRARSMHLSIWAMRQTRVLPWYGARAGKLAKHTEIGARACGLKVGKFKKYRRLTGQTSKSKK